MDNSKEAIKKFAVAFFTNIKADFSWSNDTLIVSKAPKDFEEAFGKKTPYYLIFEREQENDQTELLAQGSSLLSVMTSYLDQRGQTTLLKIILDFDMQEETKKMLTLRNCEISSVTKKQTMYPLIRFTFGTTFQYLNEKEQIMTSLCLDKDTLIEIDLEKYTIVEGKKNELTITNLDQSYNLAKEKLKKLLETKTKEISTQLSKKLEKETARVREHYEHQIKELSDQTLRLNNQITELEKNIATSTDRESIQARINKTKEFLLNLHAEEKIAKLKQEESFFLTDEKHKHGLSISNKLINTSIIYYPIYTLTIFLKNEEAGRLLEIIYDPLKKTSSKLFCESCETELKACILCGTGHLVCANCIHPCPSCNKAFCITCLAKVCESCGRNVCKKCIVKCPTCGKYKCLNHIKKDSISGRDSCVTCLRQCLVCYQYTLPSHIKRSPRTQKEMCEQCLRKEIGKSAISNIFGS